MPTAILSCNANFGPFMRRIATVLQTTYRPMINGPETATHAAAIYIPHAAYKTTLTRPQLLTPPCVAYNLTIASFCWELAIHLACSFIWGGGVAKPSRWHCPFPHPSHIGPCANSLDSQSSTCRFKLHSRQHVHHLVSAIYMPISRKLPTQLAYRLISAHCYADCHGESETEVRDDSSPSSIANTLSAFGA